MANFLTQLFGSKADRDNRELKPFLARALEAEKSVIPLSNDEIRAKTIAFRNKIMDRIREEEERIAEIKKYLDENYDLEVEEKQRLYKEIETF